jgi:hypothetical protein
VKERLARVSLLAKGDGLEISGATRFFHQRVDLESRVIEHTTVAVVRGNYLESMQLCEAVKPVTASIRPCFRVDTVGAGSIAIKCACKEWWKGSSDSQFDRLTLLPVDCQLRGGQNYALSELYAVIPTRASSGLVLELVTVVAVMEPILRDMTLQAYQLRQVTGEIPLISF